MLTITCKLTRIEVQLSTTLLIIHVIHWLTAILLWGIAFYGLKYRHRPTVLAMSAFSALVGLWALGAAFTFSLPELAAKILANRIKMVAPALLPLSLLAIILSLDPQRRRWHRYVWVPASIIPAVSVVLLAHPRLHELFIAHYRLLPVDGLVLLSFGNGPWFLIHDIYARGTFFTGLFILVRTGRDLTEHHRFRLWLVVAAIVIPLLVDTIAVHLVPSVRYMQLTPLLLFVTAIVLLFAVVSRNLIAVVPFARSQILDSLGDMYLVFNEKQELVDFNREATKVLKISPHELGKGHSLLMEHSSELEELLDLASGGGGEWALGTSIFEVAAHQLKDSEVCLGTVVACKDITVRKKEEWSLKELNEIKDRVLTVISHDFQGNVIAERLIAQSLLESSERMTVEERLLAYRNLETIAAQNVALIDELLDWAKLRMSSSNTRMPIDLRQMAETTLEFLQPMALERCVSIDFSIEGQRPVVFDAPAFRTILRNLLTNAIKASTPHAKVHFRISASDSALELMVEDSGRGIAPAEMSNLFQSKVGIRAGFGLLLCRDFIASLKGQIRVESKVNYGSRFFVTLPLGEP